MRVTISRSLACAVAVSLLTFTLPCGHAVAGSRPAAHDSDFNGDGYADLAVGVPGETLGGINFAGEVQVLYGSRAGVSTAHVQGWSQDSPGVSGVSERRDNFGSGTASADFNRDGYADLAIGADGEDGTSNGAVTVLYGSSHGLTAHGNQRLTAKRLAPHGHWGDLLTTGDFDGDGYADLVIGGRAKAHPADRGSLTVIRGSSRGLRVGSRQELTSSAAGRGGYLFGPADGLATGDLNGDGRDEIAVTTATELVTADHTVHWNGAVDVIYGAGTTKHRVSTFRTSNPRLTVPQATYSIEFATSLAIGDFNGDGYGDLGIADMAAIPTGSLAICQPDKLCYGSGAVLILPGSAHGPSTTQKQLISQDTAGVPGTSAIRNSFGARLTAGDLNGDGRDDLVARSWRRSGGVANVIYGSKTGLTGHHAQAWAADSPGISTTARSADNFGGYLTIANYGAGPAGDLTISAFTQRIGSAEHAGSVHVLYGQHQGLGAKGHQDWSQQSPGVPGAAEPFDEFGVTGSAHFDNVGQ